MTLNQIKENELYFTKVLDTLGEGGVFFFKNVLEVLKKRQGFFECSKKAYLEVEKIVSQDFLHKYFKIKENEKTQNEKSGLNYLWDEISKKRVPTEKGPAWQHLSNVAAFRRSVQSNSAVRPIARCEAHAGNRTAGLRDSPDQRQRRRPNNPPNAKPLRLAILRRQACKSAPFSKHWAHRWPWPPCPH
jgi:hypothetical protein